MCIIVILFTFDGTANSGEEHEESQSRGIIAGNTEQHWAVALNRTTVQHCYLKVNLSFQGVINNCKML